MGPDDTTGQFERLGGALRELWTGKVPLVSLALAIVWLVCPGGVEIGYSGRLERARAELGHSVEYFVEGGRSRTGRLLPPRGGMLGMTVRSRLRSRGRPFAAWLGMDPCKINSVSQW